MKKKLVILSLFDGISCGQLAINRAGMEYHKYYASEINSRSKRVTMERFPDTIQVGDVMDLNPDDFKDVDLIIGGSPCQSISVAGKIKGITTIDGIRIDSLEQYVELKRQGKKFNPSALFWEFVRLYRGIKQHNPLLLFFLENVLNSEWELLITKAMGVEPVYLNSSIISAQNRERNYWTNIPYTPVNNKNITIGDVIPDAITGAGTRGRMNKDGVYEYPITLRKDGKANCLVCTQKPTGKYLNIYNEIQDITPEQAEVLQTLEKGYTNLQGLSKSCRFEMIGNGWTVDLIVEAFFKNLKTTNHV